MSNIINLIKILKFIPDNWDQVLKTSKDLEGYLDKAQQLLEKNHCKADNLITSFFTRVVA